MYGTSSEESLNTRLRPGVTGSTKVSKSDNNFQTELQRLIDPELADRDLKGYLVHNLIRYTGKNVFIFKMMSANKILKKIYKNINCVIHI